MTTGIQLRREGRARKRNMGGASPTRGQGGENIKKKCARKKNTSKRDFRRGVKEKK